MSKPFFSIILPTYNRLYSIKEIFLPSLEKQIFLDFEVIIIDDCSTDGTEKYFNSKKFIEEFPNCSEKLVYVKNELNIGSPSSRNVGFDKTNGLWVFMTEDDLEIKDKDFLLKSKKYITEFLLKDSNIGVFSPKREEVVKGYYQNFNGNLVNYGILSKEIYLDPILEYSGYLNNTHACSFIRGDIIKYIKYNTSDYKYFREESDFYERIKKNGFKIYYLGDKLKTYHRMDLASNGGNRKHSISIRNEFKYIYSHYIFVKNNFNLAYLRTFFFILVRGIKHFSNLTGLKFIKNILAFICV